MNYLPEYSMPSEKGEILDMNSPRKVSIKWNVSKKRWEVSFYWEGYKNAFRFYSWSLPNGQRVSFTEKNKSFATQYADYIRGLMMPNPTTGICNFDPCKLSKQRKSKYALSRYGEIWLKECENRIRTGDLSSGYVSAIKGYLDNHTYSMLGEVSIYDLDTITIKEFYLRLSDKGLSKKHVQNIMDCFRMLLKSASEDLQGFEMPKFPKYREKRRVKAHNFLLREDQDRVISYVERHHKAMAMAYIYYGLRRQEVINLKRTDLIFLKGAHGHKHPALRVETLKGGPERYVEIDQEAYREILKLPPATCGHLIHFNGQPYYFKTFSKIIKRALVRAGFPEMRPHDASRHSRASQMAMKGASAYQINQEMGWADIRTAEIYVHLLNKERVVEDDDGRESKSL